MLPPRDFTSEVKTYTQTESEGLGKDVPQK